MSLAGQPRTNDIRYTNRGAPKACTGLNWEPVSGFEPLTCRLQEVRFVAICALTALMPHVIALMALAELGFSGGSSHDSSYAAKQQLSRSCNAALIQRLLTNPAPGRRRSGRILSPPTA